ncbi:hypothetical protein LDENG_00284630 [Lucifuga dentata]|nr:hypothetical protein LDENG_00284630 [Lucifuga dentata]
MIPLLLAVICFSTVKGFSIPEYAADKVCYGATYTLPSQHETDTFSGVLTFTPSKGGEKKIVMNNTRIMDPRYKVIKKSISVPDLTERDEGTFAITWLSTGFTHDIIRLKVVDCSEEESRKYGALYTCKVPDGTQFLEFTPRSKDETTVLWNLTDSQTHRGGRGEVWQNVWEMKKLTQADNGYYNFRGKDNVLLRRWRLTVEAYTEYVEKKVKEDLIISFALEPDMCTVTFRPYLDMKPMVLMKSGVLVHADHYMSDQQFSGRIKELKSTVPTLGIKIENLEKRDSGRFEITDQNGNLGLVLQLKVHEEPPNLYYAPIILTVCGTVGFIGLIFCCWCVRKRCCTKSSSKRDNAVPQSEHQTALPVYYHNMPQPAGTSYLASSQVPPYTYHPVNPISHPISSSETTSGPPDPPAYSPAGVHMSSSQPQVTPQGTASSVLPFGSDSLSSAPAEHQFELDSLKFPSAPPLSSDTSVSDIFKSDKLNFL